MKDSPIKLRLSKTNGDLCNTLNGKNRQWALDCGLSDAIIASRLGVSLRTVRRLKKRKEGQEHEQ